MTTKLDSTQLDSDPLLRSEGIQVVWAHPRDDSLTAQIVQDVLAEIRDAGLEVEELDLYRMRFDPVLYELDEPDWENLDKTYSDEVMRLISHTQRATKVVFVFPVWWYSVPSIMKGFIDRVWNHGYFYGGGRRMNLKSVLWVGLAGDTRKAFQKRNYDSMMEQYLNLSIANYCGAEESRLVLLYNTLADEIDDFPAHVTTLREEAKAAVQALIRV